MRTLKNLSLTLILIVSVSALSYAVIFSGENSGISTNAAKPGSAMKTDKQFVHTVSKNGKLIPMVNLPVVTIYGKRNTNNMVLTAKRGNEIIARVDLPEVVISAEKKTAGFRLSNQSGKNANIPMAYLPEVVIIAERKGSNSFAWQKTNENNIPVVNLPEVIITADFPENNKVMAVLYKGNFISSVNLPEVEITAYRPGVTTALDEEDRSSKNGDFYFKDFVKAEAKSNQSLNLVIFILAKASSLKF